MRRKRVIYLGSLSDQAGPRFGNPRSPRVVTSSALTSNQRGIFLVTHLVPRYRTTAARVSDGHGMLARWGNHHRDFTVIHDVDQRNSAGRRSSGPYRLAARRSVLHLGAGTNISCARFGPIRRELVNDLSRKFIRGGIAMLVR